MTKKILYFLAGEVATTEEKADIAALMAITDKPYEVGVRNTLQSQAYGAGIEHADMVAGTIPTAYSNAGTYPVADPDNPPPPPVAADQVVITSGAAVADVELVGTAGAGKSMVLTIVAGVVTTATFT